MVSPVQITLRIYSVFDFDVSKVNISCENTRAKGIGLQIFQPRNTKNLKTGFGFG